MSRKKDTYGKYSKSTFLVHGLPHDAHWEYGHHVIPPITASTTFRLDSTARGAEGFRTLNDPALTRPGSHPIYIYDRLGEPTVALLEHSFQEIEGGDSATAFGSGMAAISATLLALCKHGDEVLAHKTIYGCTYSLLTNWFPKYGMAARFDNFMDLDRVRSLIRKRTRVLYFETPANPTMDIIDIRGIADIAAQVNRKRSDEDRLWVVVDNTFATPYCQRPLSLGADIVVHSLTKNVMGFGTDMGGMSVAPLSLHQRIRLARKDFGGVEAPRAAWNILVYGLQSLPIRMERQIATATAVARFLEARKEVRSVRYPGLESHGGHPIALKQMLDFNGRFAPGLMIYFELQGKGDALLDAARRFMDHVADHSYTLTLAVSLGQAKTLIEAPALMTHAAYGAGAEDAGMSVGGIRLSVGLEEVDDILADLDDAFKACSARNAPPRTKLNRG